MNIQPIRRAINNQDYVEWFNNSYEDVQRYTDFIIEMSEKGIDEDEINEMWLRNFGVIPPEEPDRIYQCNILESEIKIVVTVLRKHNPAAGEKKFEVVKLNHLFLDTYDNQRTLVVEDGRLVMKVTYKDLSTPVSSINIEDLSDEYVYFTKNGQESYPINYEDSNWFTNLSINGLLSRLKLAIKKYDDSEPLTSNSRPKLFINNFDFMESTEIEFTDKEFEKKLYEHIERVFANIEEDLK